MSNVKKPAVVSNTTKNRGRPVGSKNTPKVDSEWAADVDWEKLAKRLQTALASEMKDHDDTKVAKENLAAKLSRKRTFWERLVCLVTGKV